MKTFEEISGNCPFLYCGCQQNLKVCIARTNFSNQKTNVIACSEKNCAVYYIANTLIQEENIKQIYDLSDTVRNKV